MRNPFFSEFLSVLRSHDVDVLLVGGYAVAVHGLVRATEDLDLWVRPSAENVARLQRALEEYFGEALSPEQAEQLRDPGYMVSFGRPPNLVDIHQRQAGADFDSAWARRSTIDFMGVPIGVVDRATLARIKRAALPKREPGSPKYYSDQADLAFLDRDEDAADE